MDATKLSRCSNAAAIHFPTTKPTWNMSRIELAKVWAEHEGVHSHRNGGGWLYWPNDRKLVQGWDNLATLLVTHGVVVEGRGIAWSRSDRIGRGLSYDR